MGTARFGSHLVAQRSDLLDRQFADVSRFHEDRRLAGETDPRRRAGRDQVAGRERHERRDIRNDVADAEHHVVGIAFLKGLAVKLELQAEVTRVTNFVRGHYPRPESAGGKEVLARADLLGVVLPIADAAVVEDRIAGDVRERRFLIYVAAAFPDHDGELDLVVEAGRDAGQDQVLAMADVAFWIAHEERRPGRRLARHASLLHLGEVISVVHADAVEVGWVRDAGQQRDVAQVVIRLLAGEASSLADQALRDERDHRRQRHAAGEIDDAVVGHQTKALAAAGCISDKSHCWLRRLLKEGVLLTRKDRLHRLAFHQLVLEASVGFQFIHGQLGTHAPPVEHKRVRVSHRIAAAHQPLAVTDQLVDLLEIFPERSTAGLLSIFVVRLVGNESVRPHDFALGNVRRVGEPSHLGNHMTLLDRIFRQHSRLGEPAADIG